MSYVIESGIPLPRAKRGHGNHYTGPRTEWARTIGDLKVGQSVLTTDHKEYRAAEWVVIRLWPKKFAIRKIDGQGWRVWRTE